MAEGCANECARACAQVPQSQSGSLVFKTDPLAPANQALSQNDVVTDIDGIPIADGVRSASLVAPAGTQSVSNSRTGHSLFSIVPLC